MRTKKELIKEIKDYSKEIFGFADLYKLTDEQFFETLECLEGELTIDIQTEFNDPNYELEICIIEGNKELELVFRYYEMDSEKEFFQEEITEIPKDLDEIFAEMKAFRLKYSGEIPPEEYRKKYKEKFESNFEIKEENKAKEGDYIKDCTISEFKKTLEMDLVKNRNEFINQIKDLSMIFFKQFQELLQEDFTDIFSF